MPPKPKPKTTTKAAEEKRPAAAAPAEAAPAAGGRRYDAETGALTHDHPPPDGSSSDRLRFLRNPKADADHPMWGFPATIHLLVGPLGCGKSSCIYGILEEADAVLAPRNLGRILYYSGSGSDKILDVYKEPGSKVELFSPESKESFQETLRSMLADAATTAHADKKHTIIVVEDAANDAELLPPNIKCETPLGRIAMALRHLPVTLIVSSQKLSALPAFMRANATHLYVFRNKCEAERKDVLKAASFSKKEFERAMDTLTEPGHFLWLNQHRRTLCRGFVTGLVH